MEQCEGNNKALCSQKLKRWMVSLLCFVLIGGAIITMTKGRQDQLPSNGAGLSGYVIGEGVQPYLTPEQIQEMLDKQVDESQIAFSINSMPVFNGTVGTIMFANPPYNAHDLDLTVYLDGKEIVKTGKIKPNQYIEKIELIGGILKKGEYTGLGVITAYHKDTGVVVGQTQVEMEIVSE